MNIIYYVTNFLGIVAGIACVGMICVSVYQIMTNDEQTYKKYQIRIKHGIIALILIISISSIKNIVLDYFPYVESSDAIGDFSSIQISLSDGALTDTYEDVEGRKVIKVDGVYYVNTEEKTINLGGLWNTYKIKCEVYKLYDDCQGITKGAMAEAVYYMSVDEDKLDGQSKGFLMSVDVQGTIKDDSDLKNLMGDWLTTKYQQYEVVGSSGNGR